MFNFNSLTSQSPATPSSRSRSFPCSATSYWRNTFAFLGPSLCSFRSCPSFSLYCSEYPFPIAPGPPLQAAKILLSLQTVPPTFAHRLPVLLLVLFLIRFPVPLPFPPLLYSLTCPNCFLMTFSALC